MTSHNLIVTFAVSGVLLVIAVLIHGVGLFTLSRIMRSEANAERLAHITPLSLHGVMFTLLTVLAIIALHGIEIWVYSLFYWAIGASQSFHDALFFSTISYSTVGYDADLIDPRWQMVGAFESILGMILIGWSTAFFIRMLTRIDRH